MDIVENLTEALHKTRISTNDTAQITMEETITGNETYEEKEQEKACISRDGDDSSSCASSTGEGGWSSSNGSQSSDSTRSRTFSIYCVRDNLDDYDTCSSISTVSNFLRDDEEEISYTSSDDKDDDNYDLIRIQQTGSQEFLEEVLDDDSDSDSNFATDDDDDDDDSDDDYDEVSYDTQDYLDETVADDEYGDDKGDVGNIDHLIESDRLLDSVRSAEPNMELVLEISTPNKLRVFSSANTRQSHSRQMEMFLKNIAETKKAVGILDDESVEEDAPETDVVEEEDDDEEEEEVVVEEIEEEEEEYVEVTEVDDDDDDYEYEVLPATPEVTSPKKLKQKDSKDRRLSMLSV